MPGEPVSSCLCNGGGNEKEGWRETHALVSCVYRPGTPTLPHFAWHHRVLCGQFNLSLTMGKGELLNSFIQIARVAVLITPVASLWLLKSQTPTLLPICRPWRAINESTLLNQKTPRTETIMRSYCIRYLKKLTNVSQKKSAVSHHRIKGSGTRSSSDCFPSQPLSCWVVLCPPPCCLHPVSASGCESRRASPDVPRRPDEQQVCT